MRIGTKTNSLVITSNRNSLYEDRITDKVLHYTGEGLIGDQRLVRGNLKLKESDTNGVDVYYFNSLVPNKYRYYGLVQLAADPYQEIQLDKDNKERWVWVFPLERKDGGNWPNEDGEEVDRADQKRESKTKKKSDLELGKILSRSPSAPGERLVSRKEYVRNKAVIEAAHREANGICQLCDNSAPFLKKKNKINDPFLEVHHIKWLSKKGDDTLDNAVALCPNCHRRIHHLDDKKDKNRLLALKKKNRLLLPELYGAE
jgi:5-methylcytosine-specific restriction enzyme A